MGVGLLSTASTQEDLRFIESGGKMPGADPSKVSEQAKKRQLDQMGTLGSGNHYLEVQKVVKVYDAPIARAFGIEEGDIKISIHCGSRGLGHQIGADYLKRMAVSAKEHGIELAERELACAPLQSSVGQSYLGAMRSGINCALANRQILMHLVREIFERVCPKAHPTFIRCLAYRQEEEHEIDRKRRLFVHRGATRALAPVAGSARRVPKRRPASFDRHNGHGFLYSGGYRTGRTIVAEFLLPWGGSSDKPYRRHKRWHGKDIMRHLAGRTDSKPIFAGPGGGVSGLTKTSAKLWRFRQGGPGKKVAQLMPLICIKG